MVLLHTLLARPFILILLGFWATLAFHEHRLIMVGICLVVTFGMLVVQLRKRFIAIQTFAHLMGACLGLLLVAFEAPSPNLGGVTAIRGWITSDPKLVRSGWPTVEVHFISIESGGKPLSQQGKVRVLLKGMDLDEVPAVGSAIMVRGSYHPNSGLFFSENKKLALLREGPEWQQQRQKLFAIIRKTFSTLRGQAGPLAIALLLGQGDELTQEEKQLFREAGASPLLALSGLHLGILAGLLSFLVKNSFHRVLAQFLVALALILFVMLVGPLPSLMRALVFWVAIHVTSWLCWEVDPLEVNSMGAFFLLLVFPDWVFNPSFILSLSAMIGILLLSNDYQDYLRLALGKRTSQLLSVGMAASAGTGPASLVLFDSFYPQAVLSNLVGILPLVVFLYGELVYLLLSLFPVLAPLQGLVGLGLELVAQLLFWLMGIFSVMGRGQGFMGWGLWFITLAPALHLVYRYWRYGYLLQFPRPDSALFTRTRVGSS